ncbi:Dihydrolipoyllysine-residue acetyltransferase component of pyruvate dehydrogenase complex [Candidatus Thermoflexus japonica]|uniref:Dihydrolipoamide acetyltransferase component of pyruvate dehydrogenase complex n=1 Tax=Candidatus Thermoflexus japonica TaxID=2035417 RepID=A0A2H5Y661_9CHLR|nr:Dihydrolipoyllysine-residue acetyltransferase component of pyruvate dehydrogenase complex [Candidatus Thermoflexus japonica]
MREVIMPALGAAQRTGRLVRWLKREGELVQAGEPLMEIETDKVTVEIEAPASGILTGIRIQEGEEAAVGQVIAWIVAPDESTPKAEEYPATEESIPSEASHPEIRATPVAARMAAEHGIDLREIRPEGGWIRKQDVLAYLEGRQRPASPSHPAGRIPASPKARRLAQELGIDLRQVQGSGPEGAVRAADVLAFHAAQVAAAPSPSSLPAVWRTMVERLTRSWPQTPHFYLQREARAARLLTWHERIQKRLSIRLTYTDLLIKLIAAALREHPRINAWWQEGTIVVHEEIHIGLAVATEEGLVVPVIHHADQLTLEEIAARRQELVERARAGRLRPEDVQGGTFTISNLGMYGVDAFMPVVNPPQAAILAVGRITERVVPTHGQPTVQPMLTLTLACDHRAIDGARAAQFLATLAELIEEPLGLLH